MPQVDLLDSIFSCNQTLKVSILLITLLNDPIEIELITFCSWSIPCVTSGRWEKRKTLRFLIILSISVKLINCKILSYPKEVLYPFHFKAVSDIRYCEDFLKLQEGSKIKNKTGWPAIRCEWFCICFLENILNTLN